MYIIMIYKQTLPNIHTNEKVLTRFAVPGLNKGTAELKLAEEDMN